MARTSEASRNDVHLLFAEMTLSANGKRVSASAVYKALKKKNGGREVRSLRSIQQDLKELKTSGGLKLLPFEPEIWQPWKDDSVPAVHLPGVLLIDSVSRVLAGQPLMNHEAKWAGRIYAGMDGLDPVAQWVLVTKYASIESFNTTLGLQMFSTFALDQLLAYQPWKPERRNAWNHWVNNTLEGSRNFINAPDGFLLKGSVREWANTQMVGPWDAVTYEWAWERVLEREFGGTSSEQEVRDAEAQDRV